MLNSYDKFTTNFKKVIQRAAWVCLNDVKKVITAEHLLLGIVSVPESFAYTVLKKTGVLFAIEEQLKTAPSHIQYLRVSRDITQGEILHLSMDKDAIKVLEKAADLALSEESSHIGTEHLLDALLELETAALLGAIEKSAVPVGEFKQSLQARRRRVKAKTQTALGAREDPAERDPALRGELLEEENVVEKTIRKDEFIPTPALDHFTVDLTGKKFQERVRPVIGREKEIERIVHILSRKEKNNPLLLGEPGVGKTALVEGLAERIVRGAVSPILSCKRIMRLDLNAVVAGTIYRGEFEHRIKQIIDEVLTQDDVILFIDEIHNLVGAGSASGSLDAANILKPYLARGEISCIGATTMAEYKAHFENDATLERRFQTVAIEEPSAEQTVNILLGIKEQLGAFHRVAIMDEAITEAVTLSERFLPHKFFPDKAIDLIDEAASRVKVRLAKDTFGKEIRAAKDKLKKLGKNKEETVRREDFLRAVAIKDEEEKIINLLKNLKEKREKETETPLGSLVKDEISQVVMDMINVPFLEKGAAENLRLLELENVLQKRVLGQTNAIKEIARSIRRAQAGLSDPKRPLGSFIFLGPSGVGKTETAKAIAEEIFKDRGALIRINMSEFQEGFNVSKLIGAPAGYVGYREGNQLADKVRQKPYCVVLFDEMEKAHPDVFNLLLQVLDDGYMQDSTGRHVNFKNTIIIFTSNIGLERFNQVQQIGFAARSVDQKHRLRDQFEMVKANILEELHNSFRVEFLNRIDKILVFEPLGEQTVREIVKLNIAYLNSRLKERGITLTLSPGAQKLLAEDSFSPDDGARSVRRLIQEKIEEPLVEKLLRGEVKEGGNITIRTDGDRIRLRT
ncbi:MAG: ATP-dependent Clp protease ATP-binding subunit [Candidatus Jacksonbacteria bacterium]|nr:ATP-dependent Clp protease ATP-binding subunit [Candidatus Jacksonbacteria bacterium]